MEPRTETRTESHGGISPQIRMANEIAVQFHHQPPEEAAAAIAAHIRAFWEPRMRAELLRRAEAEPQALDPLALAAARLLRG
ncbi:formate dehydrogenase subunit delta [Micromonospora sp. HM5-17]|uniref:formate dehydrogenase subunit delta n=1 Tax=Micromonospora sp. HM5-17 TaxID=2487710 RepID=UPI0018F4861B|nr:formate dehydrogenase subunit delta [Micromonospora sp. HM5-17]